jgi:hypothetical protein
VFCGLVLTRDRILAVNNLPFLDFGSEIDAN